MVMTVLVGLMLMTILLGLAGSCPQGHPQKNSRRAVCKSNLRQIALACQIYADDNDDRFPDDLSQLGPEYLKSVKANPKVFLCPSAADRKTSSYTLVPGLHADMPGSFILAYEPLEDHRGQGRNVAYVDTRVVWTLAGKPGEFEAELAKQREAARNWKPPEKAKQR
jgi:hypothetical protein